MDPERTGDGEAADTPTADDMTGATAPERSTMQIKQKVSGDNTTGTGSLVVGVAEERVTVTEAEGHDATIRHYEPGGRTDLDETEVVVHDLYDGQSVVITLEVSDRG